MQSQFSGRRNAHYTADLVVTSEHLGLVTGALQDAEVSVGDVEQNHELGLALVGLADAPGAAARLSVGGTPERDATDMDRVLHGLRRRFADRYAGWAPTMGKNRLVGEVIGGGKISHGGDDPPTATTGRFTARAAEPGRGVTVGVLDTDVAAHPWLAGGWTATAADVLDETTRGHPSAAGHATFIAGLVLSQAPGCTVEVRKVLDEDGEATSWDVAKAIAEFGRSRLDVLNLSFLCFTEDSEPPLVLRAAVDSLDRDVVVVAAAGNHGDHVDPEHAGSDRVPAWPAAFDQVVAVGAADDHGAPASFTPKDVPWMDVLVPGHQVVSTFPAACLPLSEQADLSPGDGFVSWSGSSFAAASLSGAIAARTVPGRVPARTAWHRLRDQGQGSPPFLSLEG